MRGSRTVPPSISGTPQRRQKTPSTASSSTTRRSHHSASSSPPATAWPATAAITGLHSSIRDGPIGPSPSGATRLPPPACRPPSGRRRRRRRRPLRTARRRAASSSASNARKASASACAVAPSTALRTSGRVEDHRRDGPVALDPLLPSEARRPRAQVARVVPQPQRGRGVLSADDREGGGVEREVAAVVRRERDGPRGERAHEVPVADQQDASVDRARPRKHALGSQRGLSDRLAAGQPSRHRSQSGRMRQISAVARSFPYSP